MMEKYEIVDKSLLERIVDFCLTCFNRDEQVVYGSKEFNLACKMVQKLDIFDINFLTSKIKSGEVELAYREVGGKIVAAAALEILSGRFLFFMYEKEYETYAKEIMDTFQKIMIKTHKNREFSLCIVSFMSGARKLERLGFYKIKSEIIILGIKCSALKFNQEQGSIQNY